MTNKIDNFIWYEKYRPATIKALSLTPHHKEAFESYVEKKNIPHLLLEGLQGSGKTTVAQILMDLIPCTRLELNASSKERGVDTVKGLIKEFAASQPRKGQIKIILLDEADGLTSEALMALKGTMEKYSSSCRFILTCNSVDKIIAPIQSRCTRFKFERFPEDKVFILCKRILGKEGVTVHNEDDIKEIVHKFYPDIRLVINNLQLASISGALDLKALVSLKVDPSKIGAFILKGHVFSLREYVANITDFTFAYRWLYDTFVAKNGNDPQKGEIVMIISEALSVDRQVPDREINFISCCLGIMQVLDIKWDFSK